MPVILFTGATFVKKNSSLVVRVVSFDTACLYVLTFRILEPYPSKDIELEGELYSNLRNLTFINKLHFPQILRFFAFKVSKN